jgi:beta-glucosidase-like glycosyl hydrolase
MTDTAKGAGEIVEDLLDLHQWALKLGNESELGPLNTFKRMTATLIERVSKAEQALAQAQAEVLALKSRNEDARLEYQTLADERDALRKQLYEQGTKLATADALLKKHVDGACCCVCCCDDNSRCDLCKITLAHLNP